MEIDKEFLLLVELNKEVALISAVLDSDKNTILSDIILEYYIRRLNQIIEILESSQFSYA